MAKKAILIGVVILVVVFLSTLILKVKTVAGNEMGVKESYFTGVEAEPLSPRTYFLFPGFLYTIYTYDVSSQVFIMNDTSSAVERVAEGREKDAYTVQSSEGQDMKISLNVRWKLDPAKVVLVHKTVRTNIEEKIIRPVVMRLVKDAATTRKAIEAYSGATQVALQQEIESKLTAKDGELADKGIIVEGFTIESISLDTEYITEIRARQVAQQKQLRAKEEEIAALAVAEKAKAEAQADLNTQVVEATRDKQVGILKAETEAQKQVLEAEASKKRRVMEAEAEQETGSLRAQSIKALGEAEAEATRLKLSAYSAPGADAFVKIEVSKNLGAAFSNVKGFLPADMKFNVLTDSFTKSVNMLMDGGDTSVGASRSVPRPAPPIPSGGQ